MLLQISHRIDQFIEWLGSKISWLTLILVIVICIDVFLRYVFSSTKTWILDIEWHLFSLIFLFGAAYTLKHDEHVRVDLFYQNYSQKTKSLINFLGAVFLLIPWCLIIIGHSLNYALNSWYVKEGSPDGGLSAWYPIKFCITLGFILLLLQAISIVIKEGYQLADKS